MLAIEKVAAGAMEASVDAVAEADHEVGTETGVC